MSFLGKYGTAERWWSNPLPRLVRRQFHPVRKRWNKTRNSFCCASHSRSSVTACQIVAVGTVPQSVPLGTPRKPLQGLAVPQFHDFRRIGEKNTENRSAHIPWEKDSRTFAPQARCVPRPERVGYGSAVGGEPAQKARVAPRVRSGSEGARSGTRDGVRRRKNSGFSPRFRQISAGFISRQPAMNLSIGVNEKVPRKKQE